MATENDKKEDSIVDPFSNEKKEDDKKSKADYSEWNKTHTDMQAMIGDDIVDVMSGKQKNILDMSDDDSGSPESEEKE